MHHTIEQTLQQATLLHQQGKLNEAQQLYQAILRANPQHADALHLLGVIAAQTQEHQRALEFINQAIAQNPNHASFYFNRGLALKNLGELALAISSFRQAHALKPNDAHIHYQLGLALQDHGQSDEAIASFRQALHYTPNDANTHHALAVVFTMLSQAESAIQHYQQAIALSPNSVQVHYHFGLAYTQFAKPELALAEYDLALAIQPDAKIYYDRAITLKGLARHAEAIASYDAAIALKPDYADAHYNRANLLYEENQLELALQGYSQVSQLKPDFAEAYCGQALVWQDLQHWDKALDCFQTALRWDEKLAVAHKGCGNCFFMQKHYALALHSYQRMLALSPDDDFMQGTVLHVKSMLCDWQDYTSDLAQLKQAILQERKVCVPFALPALYDDVALQKQVAEIYARTHYAKQADLGDIPRYAKKQRLRIGYYSAGFHHHPAVYLLARTFELHDKTRFECFAFSYGNKKDTMYTRMEKAFDHFLDVSQHSDKDIAKLSRECEIDIAVDLTVYLTHGRPNIFAYRCAPIQVNYLGYPGTTGSSYMDYIIADSVIIPPSDTAYYCEKIAYLPNSYQANDDTRHIAIPTPQRTELGLPKDGIVFACFNHKFKITPQLFACWMRILQAVNGSVLWLSDDNPHATQNLRQQARQLGISAQRLIFAPRVAGVSNYLARLQVADLFLDTYPFAAGTIANDALWAGLPVLTWMGNSYPSRIAASLLLTLNLPELVTHSESEYEQTAIALAQDKKRLVMLKQRVARQAKTSSLFDSQRFTHSLESLFVVMYQRYQQGLPPTHLEAVA